MNREVILQTMDLAAKQDRERFFKIADIIHLQPKYKDHLAELEVLKQQWRDMTNQPDYPDIHFPLKLPEWFPTVHFASNWDSGYVEETLLRYELEEMHSR